MNKADRIRTMIALGERLRQPDEYRSAVMHRSAYQNPWFTIENQENAIDAIAHRFLEKSKLNTWLTNYDLIDNPVPLRVGLIMAGNIPLVGFHDLLCVFLSGHITQIKLSDKDRFLVPYLLKELKSIDPRTEAYFQIVEKLGGFDAVIATGSNNSYRYFEAYFGKYPNIIRKNRNAVAVLNGSETQEDLNNLGKDIFHYFGLGCRNVSKVYIPHNTISTRY